ncbi:MAG: hypothetical protein FJ319_12435 [SAR202 cluster bacterium]|nr:hypothetical protein [SAR202 cluster bacterium]
MRLRSAIASLLIVLLSVSCGSGAEEPGTNAPVHIGSRDELIARAAEATEKLNTDKWLEFYEFKSPRSVEPRFPYGLPGVQLCTPDQFIYDTSERLAKLKFANGLDETDRVQWSVVDATIDKNIGLVTMSVQNSGQPMAIDKKDYFGENDTGVRWIYLDNNWWQEDEDWLEGCHDQRLGN